MTAYISSPWPTNKQRGVHRAPHPLQLPCTNAAPLQSPRTERPTACCFHQQALMLVVVGLCLIGQGCSKSGAIVEWPALKEMDEWAEKGEGWADGGQVGEMRKALPEIITAADKLVASPVPANAKSAAMVTHTMGDLRDLLLQLKKPSLSDDDMKTQVAAIHPLVAKLMEEAGLPHVHESGDDKKK